MASTKVITNIYIYPVKGLGGIEVQETDCTPEGLKYDRLWMIVDQHDQFLTQREFSQFALFKTAIVNNGIAISYQDRTIVLPFEYCKGNSQRFEVWGHECHGYYAREESNRWISEQLGIDAKFVSMDTKQKRMADPCYARHTDTVSFADGYPYLIVGHAALDLLNSKLDSPVTIDRFRANVVFSGGIPHEEDSWKRFSIGETQFLAVKPCARCLVITIDQRSGQKSSEPLKALSHYRNYNNKVLFGMNLVWVGGKTIKVGDTITIIE